MQNEVIYHRWAPSLGALEDTAENVWGTTEYEGDRDEPTVFFGLYGLPDFYTLWRHRGKKWILWAGTDITHFKNGYWLEEGGGIRLDPMPLAEWINKNCESWVENEVEQKALAELGIESTVGQSFLGDVNRFQAWYTHSTTPKLYTSVSGDNYDLYGWDKIPQLAQDNPDIEFHLYGNSPKYPLYLMGIPNVIIHGKVSKEEMNNDIRGMQGALRLTEFDGFSEILAKSLLMGQWPVSRIPYLYTLPVDEIDDLKNMKNVNTTGRKFYLSTLNSFPWNLKKK